MSTHSNNNDHNNNTGHNNNNNSTGANFNSIQNQAIALAGTLQAVDLVKELATTGYLNSHDFEACINSLFVTNPTNTLEVYGSLGHIERGLTRLDSLLSSKINSQHKSIIPYAVGVNNLAAQLNKNGAMLNTIAKKLEACQHQIGHFGLSHDNVIASIAECYTQTISTLSYRIQVKGEYTYLQQKRVANQIRSLLLSGIRASILWRQNGGGVFKLLFSRTKLHSETHKLLTLSKHENNP
ncbi:high frequency lysogenization protein HflD [Marinagarivorans algicola]|uniref:high frequency lysogenization protein HflD n=1 Tax=Marinagarivorans algicola TaxID=1513270 RepID=UPI0006B517F1|nr:high frequency lysogenization protein HflD [Marinagarivorans algicola]